MKMKSVTEARGRLQEVLDNVHYTKEPLMISKNGKPWVIVQPLPEDDKDLQSLIAKKEG